MTADTPVPAEIEALAQARAAARLARDFERADALRASIEAAGWKLVDDGVRWTLVPARPHDQEENGRVVHGSPASVPRRPGAARRPTATVVIHSVDVEATAATLAALGTMASTASMVLVADAGAVHREQLLDGIGAVLPASAVEVGSGEEGGTEVLWMRPGISPGAALLSGLRRAIGDTVIVLEAGRRPLADLGAPTTEALSDETVGAVGSMGLRSSDLHRWQTASTPGPVTALGPGCLAFRRSDVGLLETVDERLASVAGVSAWCSLALRVGVDGAALRTALALDLPLAAPESAASASPGGPIDRRDRYRIAARFAGVPGLGG